MFDIMFDHYPKNSFLNTPVLRTCNNEFCYLFLLVIEGFTALLKYRMSQAGDFSFHPKCRTLDITHLIFADELFVVCGAEVKSFQLIADALQYCRLFSGLKPNMQKSFVFFSGVTEVLKARLNGRFSIVDEVRAWMCS